MPFPVLQSFKGNARLILGKSAVALAPLAKAKQGVIIFPSAFSISLLFFRGMNFFLYLKKPKCFCHQCCLSIKVLQCSSFPLHTQSSLHSHLLCDRILLPEESTTSVLFPSWRKRETLSRNSPFLLASNNRDFFKRLVFVERGKDSRVLDRKKQPWKNKFEHNFSYN